MAESCPACDDYSPPELVRTFDGLMLVVRRKRGLDVGDRVYFDQRDLEWDGEHWREVHDYRDDAAVASG